MPAKNNGMVAGSFWALLRHPDGLPVVFASKQDAEENRDFDEYLVQVRIHPASAMALLRGRQELLRRRKMLEKARPRVPDEQKRRRGSALKIVGGNYLRKALQGVRPKLEKEAKRAIAKSLRR